MKKSELKELIKECIQEQELLTEGQSIKKLFNTLANELKWALLEAGEGKGRTYYAKNVEKIVKEIAQALDQ